MEIETKYFSCVTYAVEDVISFEHGLFGFENENKFILIPFENDFDSLLCLQSTEDKNLAFILINPYNFLFDYRPNVPQSDISSIGAENLGEIELYTICVIRDNMMDSTANLRCPILINPTTKKAIQIILDDTNYQFKFPFSKFVDKEG